MSNEYRKDGEYYLNQALNSAFRYLGKRKAEEYFNDTVHYQRKYGFAMGTGPHATWNNEADAFKHAFMEADVARIYGNNIANKVGKRHEIDGNMNSQQPRGEENMDKWNNRVSRQITAEIKQKYPDLSSTFSNKNWKDTIAGAVNKKLRAGELITNPTDKRKFVETGYAAPISNNQNTQNGHWITKNGNHVFIEE